MIATLKALARVHTVATCLVLTLCGLTACDGIGRELVTWSRLPPSPEGGCPMPPSCDAAVPAFDREDSLPGAAIPLSLADCAADAMRCPLDALLDAGQATDEGDAGVRATDACSSDQDLQALEQGARSCTNIRVTLDPSANDHVSRTTSLSNVNVALASATPVTLTLDQSSLQDVFVRLEGAVTLRITNARTFDHVSISGYADEHGAPHVAIEDIAEATALAVGEAGSAFAGSLVIARSKLDNARLSADTIELSSVRAETIALSTRSVLAADTALLSATLELGTGAFSASRLSAVHVLSCDALALISTDVTQCELPTCRDEPLRVYSSNVSDTTLDGAIDSDESSWSGVRFGLHAPTELLGWGTLIESATFCAHSSALRFGATANRVHCSDCTAEALPMPICTVPTGQVGVRYNLCEALQPAADASVPTCEGGPFPDRPRPR